MSMFKQLRPGVYAHRCKGEGTTVGGVVSSGGPFVYRCRGCALVCVMVQCARVRALTFLSAVRGDYTLVVSLKTTGTWNCVKYLYSSISALLLIVISFVKCHSNKKT